MTELCKTGVLDSIEQQFYGNISFAVRVDIMKNYCIEIFGVKDNKLISEYAFLSSSIVELPELISRLKDGISEEELSFISETLIYRASCKTNKSEEYS